LAGLIDNYFGGYYAEKMVEAQVCLCIDLLIESMNQHFCQLPYLLGMVDKALQLSLELRTCWVITLLCELSVNLCQQVDQLVFEQLVHERFPRLCESFLFC
jgi:hypothetical protein